MLNRYVPNEILDQVIEDLCGSCQRLDTVLAEYGYDEQNMTIEDYGYIESEIFLCAGCGWWCSNDELCDAEDGYYCRDCYDDELVEQEDEE